MAGCANREPGSHWMLRAGVAAVVCFGAAVSAPDAATSIAAKAIVLVLDAPSDANTVWPGFSLPERDWLVYDSSGAYLVTRSVPPASFVANGRWFFHTGALPGLNGTQNTAYRLGDLTVTAIPVGTSPEATASTLYHEAFHAFQDGRFRSPARGSFLSGIGGELTRELAASIEVERRVLRDAIRAKGIDQARLRQAVAVRDRRSASSSDAILAAERHAEQYEGLAQYVEEHSIQRARRRPARAAVDAVAFRLAFPMREFGSPDERLVRVRAYGTGAAIGILLDRLAVDWKDEAQTEPLDRLLARHVAVPADRTEALAAEAYARYKYAALLTAKDPPWGDLRIFGEREFDAIAPYRLVIEIGPRLTMAWNASTVAGRPSGSHQPGPGVMLLPFADRFAAEEDGLTVSVNDRPVRLDVSGTPRTITILLSDAPRLNGERVTPGYEREMSAARVEADGATVTVSMAVRVTAEASQLRIMRRPTQ